MDDRQALKVRFANFGAATPPPVPTIAASVPVPMNDTLSEPKSAPLMRAGFDKVQLKVRRTQNKGLVGGVGFSVHFIAELSPEAKTAVKLRLGQRRPLSKRPRPQTHHQHLPRAVAPPRSLTAITSLARCSGRSSPRSNRSYSVSWRN